MFFRPNRGNCDPPHLTEEQKEEIKKLGVYLREHRKIFEDSLVMMQYAIDNDYPISHWWWYLPVAQ